MKTHTLKERFKLAYKALFCPANFDSYVDGVYNKGYNKGRDDKDADIGDFVARLATSRHQAEQFVAKGTSKDECGYKPQPLHFQQFYGTGSLLYIPEDYKVETLTYKPKFMIVRNMVNDYEHQQLIRGVSGIESLMERYKRDACSAMAKQLMDLVTVEVDENEYGLPIFEFRVNVYNKQ